MPTHRRTPWLGLCCALFTIAGCTSINEKTPYPQDWPRPAQSALLGCPDLSGTFEDAAVEVFPLSSPSGSDARPSLTAIIAQVWRANTGSGGRKLDGPPKSMPDSRSVELALTASELRVRRSPPERSDTEFTFRRAELLEIRLSEAFTCSVSDLGAELRFLAQIDSVAGMAGFFGFGQRKISVSLFQSSDQSLLVRWNKQTAGVIVLAPYVTNESTWVRFRRSERSSR